MEIKKVLVVGVGTMGQQIGFQCAIHGFETIMYNHRPQSLENCRLAHAGFASVFRESRGGEVKRKRFTKQFRGKTLDSPLRLGRDVDGVTGATYSSRAVVGGVRRALELIEARYPRSATP